MAYRCGCMLILTHALFRVPSKVLLMAFMCVSFLFAAQVFAEEKLRRWVHWMFVGTGITGLVVFIDPLFRLPIAFLIVDGIAGSIFLTLAPVLLAVLFRRDHSPIPKYGQPN